MDYPKKLQDFTDYCARHITGDEKGEAQTFLDRFFSALGHSDGYKGAGATLEARIKNEDRKGTGFADLLWPGRVLIEMKKRGEDLSLHLQQAIQYWMQSPSKMGRYIVLCNFDEFWIYDTKTSFYKPVDVVPVSNLEAQFKAFAFLFPKEETPLFDRNYEDVTKQASYLVASVFKSMTKRNVEPAHALRFCMQSIIALFAEDVNLLPNGIYSQLIDEALEGTKNQGLMGGQVISVSYDLIGGLFEAMNKPGLKAGGRYKGVDYFNGGLFNEIYPIELTFNELNNLNAAAKKNWRNVNPAIFGSIFEDALDKDERHILGAHYTHELDIKKIVDPCIVEPWSERLEGANKAEDLEKLLHDLSQYRVLDPACGSGNFLFVAFKEMKMLEKRAITKLRAAYTIKEMGKMNQFLLQYHFVNIKQFYGLDIKPFAVELAKVTLMVAKELSWLENKEAYDNKFQALPLDNLEENIVCCDALLAEDGSQRQWPEVEVIVGNPPYQSHANMKPEFGMEYVSKLWTAYPEISGKADFCVYWFFKAHNHIKLNSFAGLVGTNTIRQNKSREGSLGYIESHGGYIFNAVSSQNWSGEAAVYVSIVSWKKGEYHGTRKLFVGNDHGENLIEYRSETISSSLSLGLDVAMAQVLSTNRNPKKVFKGQMPGHEGFLVPAEMATKEILKNLSLGEVMFPILNGTELLSKLHSQPERFVIDFGERQLMESSSYKFAFEQVKRDVLPDREKKAKEQEKEIQELIKSNPKAKASNKHHINFYRYWWRLGYPLQDMIDSISKKVRYISCSRVTARPIFEYVSSKIHPSDALMVFSYDDDYSFGLIQSCFHWEWLKAKCSTLGEQLRYTAESVWDTFPWPQSPNQKQMEAVAKAALTLRLARKEAMKARPHLTSSKGRNIAGGLSLRDLYRLLELPGKNSIKDLHHALDKAVAEAYGFKTKLEYSDGIYLKDANPVLEFLLALNLEVAEKEAKGETVQGPGLPEWAIDKEKFVTEDCVMWEG